MAFQYPVFFTFQTNRQTIVICLNQIHVPMRESISSKRITAVSANVGILHLVLAFFNDQCVFLIIRCIVSEVLACNNAHTLRYCVTPHNLTLLSLQWIMY